MRTHKTESHRCALAPLLARRCPATQVRRACPSLCSLRLLRRREYSQEQQEHSDGRTTQYHRRLAFVLAELAAGGSGLLGLPRLVKRLADDFAPLNPALSIRCFRSRGLLKQPDKHEPTILAFAKTPQEPETHPCNMLRGPLHAIHLKRVLNFGERQSALSMELKMGSCPIGVLIVE